MDLYSLHSFELLCEKKHNTMVKTTRCIVNMHGKPEHICVIAELVLKYSTVGDTMLKMHVRLGVRASEQWKQDDLFDIGTFSIFAVAYVLLTVPGADSVERGKVRDILPRYSDLVQRVS